MAQEDLSQGVHRTGISGRGMMQEVSQECGSPKEGTGAGGEKEACRGAREDEGAG